MTGGEVLRKVLNLPDRPLDEGDGGGHGRAHEPVLPQGYAYAAPSRRGGAARRVGRVVLWSLVVLLMLLGVRTLVRPSTGQHSTVPASASFPEGEAQGVAQRFVTTYLTNSPSDSAATTLRSAQLEQDQAKGVNVDTQWAGGQTTTVEQVVPAGVQVAGDGKNTMVRVLAQLRIAGSGHAKGSVSWVAMSVPVQRTSTRVAVAGGPTFVTVPAPGGGARPVSVETDQAITDSTRDGVRAFFAAYGGSDVGALQQVTAPGSMLLPLGAVVTLDSLTTWTVDSGSSTTRTGHAGVVWRLGASTVPQHYRVSLVSVSGAGAQSWRVLDVTPEVMP